MRKYQPFIFVLFLVGSQGLIAQNLTKELLVKNEFWINGPPLFSYQLTFYPNNGYVLNFGVEGEPWTDSGKYEIKDNSLYLYCLKNDSANKRPDIIGDMTMGNAKGKIVQKENDLYNSGFLQITTNNKKDLIAFSDDCQCALFPIPGMEVSEGSKRTAAGVEIITSGNKTAITTSNVKIRDKPSVKGNAIPFVAEYFGGEEAAFVPKDFELTMIGRTLNKEKIDKYEDYWYYVNVGTHSGVWMYGAFIQPKQ